jgi:hypothetical protein
MKKLLFAVSALAALSLLAPSSGLAQPYYNQLGLYLDEAGTITGAQDAVANQQFLVHVIISNPRNLETGTDLTSIKAVEWGVVPPSNVFILALNFPSEVLNVGTMTNAIVGYGLNPVPVTSGIAVLATYQILFLGVAETFYLTPTTPASIPGLMAIVDVTDTLIGVYPASGSFDNPVFGINNGANPVATDMKTMDAVKALYR